jgi:hypothetical protein
MIPAYTAHFSRLISGLYSSDRSGPLRNLHLLLDLGGSESIWSKLQQAQRFILPVASMFDPTQVSIVWINPFWRMP